jgi:hypothetical protein
MYIQNSLFTDEPKLGRHPKWSGEGSGKGCNGTVSIWHDARILDGGVHEEVDNLDFPLQVGVTSLKPLRNSSINEGEATV